MPRCAVRLARLGEVAHSGLVVHEEERVSAGESGLRTSAPTREPQGPSTSSIRLDAARSSTSIARRWVRAVLREVVAEDVIDDVALVVSELIANSVEHTSSQEILLSVRVDGKALVVRVHDQGPGLPSAWPVPGLHERSRGLMMVSKLSTSVSSRAVPEGGAVVEAVIPNESGAGSDA